jgi:hypothetical protein
MITRGCWRAAQRHLRTGRHHSHTTTTRQVRPYRHLARLGDLRNRGQTRASQLLLGQSGGNGSCVCADVVTDGWQDTVASRAADCLKPKTWNRLFGRRRDGDWKAVAALAKALLDGKEKLHELVGEASGWLAEKLGLTSLERTAANGACQEDCHPGC